MGCCYSRVEREEIVSRCRARKRYAKELVEARRVFSAAQALYIRSLRTTGSALLHFANAESDLHHYPHLRPASPTPPPLSPTSPTTWAPVSTSPPPPPPPPPSSWDFWDPFVPWENNTTSATAADPTPAAAVHAPLSAFSKPSSEELAVVISRNSKSLRDIVSEIHDYFLKAADAGCQVSFLLEAPSGTFSTHPLAWTWGSPWKLTNFVGVNEKFTGVGKGHSSTVEKLCAWEKKLYFDVESAEMMKAEHDNKVSQLRNMEIKRAEQLKVDKARKEIDKLESRIMVASQAIETTSDEIVKLRESELYPQILNLVKGLICMWRSMYACHQVQVHIVHQLKYLNLIPSTQTPSEIHRQSVLQLELEINQWQTSFCNLLKSQRLYIQSLAGWLRLSLFQLKRNPLSQPSQESGFYSLCEEWHLAIDRMPDSVASEGINSLSTAIHAIIIQQEDEHRQKKKSDAVFRLLEKRAIELKTLESKYGPYFVIDVPTGKNPVEEKRFKVDALKAKAEEEKKNHENSITLTRTMTLTNLQIALPHTFQAMSRFSSVCMQMFESAYSKAKGSDHLEQDSKNSIMY